MASKFSLFSKMNWLDEKIKINQLSEGRNANSDLYYATLLAIKNAQNNGTITDELYTKLRSFYGNNSPEEGYYYANIHYDLFYENEIKEDIEERMIHFFKYADKMTLKNSTWFTLNFKQELRYFMSHRYGVNNDEEDEIFFTKYANKIEKYLFDEYKTIISMSI